jgi:membrane protease YdiL (CAAX protease family)
VAPPLALPSAAGLALLLLAVLPISLIGAWSLLAGALATQAALVVITLAWARRSGFEPRLLLRFGPPSPRALLLGASVGLAGILAGGGMQGLARYYLPQRLMEGFDVGRALLDAGWSRTLLVLVVSVLPPICEELAFRAGLQSALLFRRPPWLAIGLSALAFAAFHLDPVRFGGVLLLGLFYGWLAWRTGSAFPSMVAHAVNNSTAALGLLAAGREGLAEQAEAVPVGDAAAVLLVGLAVFALLVASARRWLPPAPEAAAFLMARDAPPGGAAPPGATTAAAAPSPSGTAPP